MAQQLLILFFNLLQVLLLVSDVVLRVGKSELDLLYLLAKLLHHRVRIGHRIADIELLDEVGEVSEQELEKGLLPEVECCMLEGQFLEFIEAGVIIADSSSLVKQSD